MPNAQDASRREFSDARRELMLGELVTRAGRTSEGTYHFGFALDKHLKPRPSQAPSISGFSFARGAVVVCGKRVSHA